MIIDAGPFVVDGENLNSRLWALIKRASERSHELHTTHPVLAQVGRRLAVTQTSAVVDAHLAIFAETLSTFILTATPTT